MYMGILRYRCRLSKVDTPAKVVTNGYTLGKVGTNTVISRI